LGLKGRRQLMTLQGFLPPAIDSAMTNSIPEDKQQDGRRQNFNT